MTPETIDKLRAAAIRALYKHGTETVPVQALDLLLLLDAYEELRDG